MKIELITREEFERRTKYWIETFVTECPVCGHGDKYLKRVLYSERDKPNPNNWHWDQLYDYCDIYLGS